MTHEERIEYFTSRYEKYTFQLRPSTNDDVAKMLAVIAATIGCPIPPTPVIAKYIEILRTYSPEMLEYAGNEILKKHKWNNFPKIAEFVEQIKEEHGDIRTTLVHIMESMILYEIKPPGPAPLIPPKGAPRRGMKSIGESIPKISQGTSNG